MSSDSFYVDLFDRLVNPNEIISESAKVEFKELMKDQKHDLLEIYKILNRTGYMHKDAIEKIFISYSVELLHDDFLDEQKWEHEKVEFVFGCRHPESNIGSWDRAMDVGKYVAQAGITLALFENGADLIGHLRSFKEARDEYTKFLKQGWIPMTHEDIKKTAGITVDTDQNDQRKPILPFSSWTAACIMVPLFAFVVYYMIQ